MQKSKGTIRRERPADYAAVEQLTREAFWNVYRPGCMEHYVVHVLRDDPAFVAELDLVLEREGQLIGHVLYMRAQLHTVDGRILPVMTFGPISIHPDFQGRDMVRSYWRPPWSWPSRWAQGPCASRETLRIMAVSGFGSGQRQGASAARGPGGGSSPYFLCKELVEGYLEGCAGVYHTPKGYFVEEEAVERFDQAFPPKKKETLPGQLF